MKDWEKMTDWEKFKAVAKVTIDALLVFTILFLTCCIVAINCGAEEVSQTSSPWKGYERTTIGYDAERDAFTYPALKGVAEAEGMRLVAETTDDMAEAAQAEMGRLHRRVGEIIDAESGRPVIHLTADLDLDDALDRENLCMCVPKWEYEPTTRKVTAKVFTNKLLASPPIVEAHFRSAMSGKIEKVKCAWDGYGTKADEVVLTHQNSYTNFVIVSRPYEAEQVLTTNVTFEVTAWEREIIETENYTYAYITDGLVGRFDGEENDGLMTHNPIATVWKNLSDVAELYGDYAAPSIKRWNDKSIVLNDVVPAGTIPPYDPRTLEVVYKATANQAYILIGFGNQTWISHRANNTINFASGGWHAQETNVGGINSVSARFTGMMSTTATAPQSIRVNGLEKITRSSGLTGNTADFSFHGQTWGNIKDTEIFSIRIYDRVLTDTEVLHNWALDNYRFFGGAMPPFDPTTTTTTTNWVEKTYTYEKTLALTNSVIITVDGAQPKITLKGDRETFECYDLVFTLPEGYDEHSLDFIQWGRIGDPQTGFNFGNRQMRVNGEMTLTTAPTDPVPSILSIGSVFAYDDESAEWVEITDYDFFTDNGHTKAIKKEDEE